MVVVSRCTIDLLTPYFFPIAEDKRRARTPYLYYERNELVDRSSYHPPWELEKGHRLIPQDTYQVEGRSAHIQIHRVYMSQPARIHGISEGISGKVQYGLIGARQNADMGLMSSGNFTC